VDPHGLHLNDSLFKLKGLCKYADEHSEHFRRIESVAEVSGEFRVLDLKEPKVRKAVLESDNVESLFKGDLANSY
jgi:hypothetical protein